VCREYEGGLVKKVQQGGRQGVRIGRKRVALVGGVCVLCSCVYVNAVLLCV